MFRLSTLFACVMLLVACTSTQGASQKASPSDLPTPQAELPSLPSSTPGVLPARTGVGTIVPVPSIISISPTPSPVPTVSPTPIPIIHGGPYIIAIEAGHGGSSYWGASSRDSDGNHWIEKDVVLDIALRLYDRLLADDQGRYIPMLIRDGDYTLTDFYGGDYRPSMIAEAQARVDMANAAPADVYLAIHLNGSNDGGQSGTETYYNPDRSFGYENYGLAFFVQDALVRHIRNAGYDVHDRGLKNDGEVNGDPANQHSYALGTNVSFNPSLMPGVISESLFLSNPADLAFIRTPNGLDVTADAYKEALDRYFEWLEGP
jgi:N-acetylmuramoyl-L-alanine amidase